MSRQSDIIKPLSLLLLELLLARHIALAQCLDVEAGVARLANRGRMRNHYGRSVSR
jgi:hypothetical protein